MLASSSPSAATPCCAAASPRRPSSSAPTSRPRSRRSPSSPPTHEVVVTHGNGPQVGLLALQGDAYAGVAPYPLDVLGAESEGMIGYLLDQELVNALGGRPVATLLTQVIVDPDDPAFAVPTKPIGPVYEREAGERLAAERGWRSRPTGRIPPGRPVARAARDRRAGDDPAAARRRRARRLRRRRRHSGRRRPRSRLRGVEAVIDKDLAAALLAEGLGADALLHAHRRRPPCETAGARPRRAPSDARHAGGAARHRFAAGSMGPKVEAACRFAERTGGIAGIGALDEAAAMIAG